MSNAEQAQRFANFMKTYNSQKKEMAELEPENTERPLEDTARDDIDNITEDKEKDCAVSEYDPFHAAPPVPDAAPFKPRPSVKSTSFKWKST